MNIMPETNHTTIKVLQHWQYLEQYLKAPQSKTDYRKQLSFLDKLMALPHHKKNQHINSLLQLVARNIENYETQHIPLGSSNAIDVLSFLMNEHSLTQTDLPEIGSQSLVSKILKGERKLTADQIGLLAQRFHVSPAVFYNI